MLGLHIHWGTPGLSAFGWSAWLLSYGWHAMYGEPADPSKGGPAAMRHFEASLCVLGLLLAVTFRYPTAKRPALRPA